MQRPILFTNVIMFVFIGFLATFFSFAPRTAQALTVSPARLEIDGNPSSQLKIDMVLTNDKDENQAFFSSYANFEAQGESGTPNFVDSATDLASWMNVPGTVTLTPFETKTIPLVINIPKTADPGGHFAAVFWSTQPAKSGNEGQVAIGAKLGILVLLRVNGDVPEGGSILNFDTRDGVHKFGALPVTFSYRFNNTGGDRVKPVGTVVIKNIFGIKTTTIDANPNQGNVLPKSIRKFETSWVKGNTNTKPEATEVPLNFWDTVSYQWHNFAFGKYTAVISLGYTSKNLTDSATTSFYVFPWQLLVVIFVGVVLVLYILRRMLRAYNRMLIAQVRDKIEEELEEKIEKKEHENKKPHTRPRV
jgi:hypothetical protein